MALRQNFFANSSKIYARSLTISHQNTLKFSTATANEKKIDLRSNPKTAFDGYIVENSIHKPKMPALGFGTWGVDHFTNDIMARSVDQALQIGYRHLDCARVYANETEIGAVMADHFQKGTCKREDLFITSKLFNHEQAPPEEKPLNALESTLKDLNVDYVDAFLIHWPWRNTATSQPRIPFNINDWFLTYKVIYEAQKRGLAKSVGICNAGITKMKGLLDLCAKAGIDKPGHLQTELHPYLQCEEVLQFCAQNDIIVTAAMPLGSPERPPRCKRDDDPLVLQDPKIKAIADECGKSVAQVIIRWHLQKKVVCIPKGTEEWMIRENFETLNFELTDEQMQRMNALDRNFRFSRGEFLSWKENQSWEEMWDYE